MNKSTFAIFLNLFIIMSDDQGEYEEYDYDQPSGYGLMSFSPMGFLIKQAKCMAISIIIFMVLIWLISLVPVIGPWVGDTIKLGITKLAEGAGVLNCG